MPIPDINLNAIRDPAVRTVVQQLLVIIETQHADLVGVRADNQRLRDQLARLKGGNSKPPVPPAPPPAATNHSSEAERPTPTPHRKRPKVDQLVPTRVQRCAVDPATLPPDAHRRGITITTVQDLRLVADEATLTAHLPPLRDQRQRQIRDQLAIAAYHAQTVVPIVQLLLCDDARQFHHITTDLALCWVHEGRHLVMLCPIVPQHQRALARIRQHFWIYYRALRAYQAASTPDDCTRLQASFTRLVTRRTGYPALDARRALLASKRESLLHVLAHPELPLHNNAMELGTRRRVRKRDISFGPRSAAGVQAWDTCMTLVATAQKLGVNVIAYLHDRFSGLCALPALAEVLTQRAQTANLGASWLAS